MGVSRARGAEALPTDLEPLASLSAGSRAHDLDLSRAYAVGGVVRDALLGRGTLDLDLAVEVDGHDFAHALARALGGSVVAAHRFGTAAVVAPLAGDPQARIDVAQTRTETYARPGALPTVTLTASIEQDLRRRDFTINAIAARLDERRFLELLDPFGGRRDLEQKLVRVLHDASFIDDPTRLFRAVRYAGRYGFELEEHTLRLALSAIEGGALSTLSVQRVRAELELLLEEPSARSIELLAKLGILRHLRAAPGAAATLGEGVATAVDAIRRVDEAEGSNDSRQAMAWRLRLALLARGLGPDGARSWLTELSLRARDVAAVVRHVSALQLLETTGQRLASTGQVAELLRDVDPESLELLELVTEDPLVRESIGRFRRARGEIALTVTGHDLLAMGIERGPAIGEVLEELYDRKLAGELADREAERSEAERLVRERLDAPGGGAG